MTSIKNALFITNIFVLLAWGETAPCETSGEQAVGQSLQSAVIWTPSAPPGEPRYVEFRKTFDLPSLPQNAQLRIFADTRYLLWINGHYVDRGPCRFDPARPEYDVIDAAKRLQPGKNAMAVLVHHYGKAAREKSRFMEHDPGLTVRLDIENADGSNAALTTDASWRVNTNTSYRPEKEMVFASVRDNIDARLDRGEWTQIEFDDSAWEAAVPIDSDAWGKMQPRSIPLLKETEIIPKTIVQETVVSSINNATPQTERNDRIQSLAEKLPLSMKSGHEIVLDIGKTVQAYSLLDFEAESGSELEIQYAVRFLDTDRKLNSELNDAPNYYIARDGRQTYMSTDTFGCRYVAIRLRKGSMILHSVKMIDRLYPYTRLGRFDCNDENLNALYRIGANTVAVCSEDAYVDCIDRERGQWIADGYLMGFPVSCAVFAGPGEGGGYRYTDPQLLRNLLRHMALSQLPDGRLQTLRPTNRPPEEIHCVLDDYSCLWVQAVREYYDLTGDREFACEMWGTLVKAMDYYLARRTSDGLYLAREFTYPNNPLAYKTCEGATFNAYLYRALIDSAYLGERLGDPKQAETYTQAAKELYARYNDLLWDSAAGSFYGAIMEGNKIPPTGHAAMLALFYDLVPSERQASTLKYMRENFKDGFPYTHYFYLGVLFRQNTQEMDVRALNTMREKWAPMLKSETETTSEGFTGGSYVHEAGAVPTYYLSRYVLGVRNSGVYPQRRISIEPHLGDLQRAEGTVLTDFGPVSVSWRISENGLAFSFEIPDNANADVILPYWGNTPTLVLNGQTQINAGHAQKGFELDSRSIRFPVTAGMYQGIMTRAN